MDYNNYVIYEFNHNESKCILTKSNVQSLMTQLVNGSLGSFGSFLSNANDYIEKITWYPLNLSLFTDTTSKNAFTIGKEGVVALSNLKINRTIMSHVIDIPILRLKTIYLSGTFLDYQPYTTIKLWLPFFDYIDLDWKILQSISDNYGLCYMNLDLRNDELTFFLQKSLTGEILVQKTIKIGIKIAMGKSNDEDINRNRALNGLGFMANLLSMGVGSATGNPFMIAKGVSALTSTMIGNISQARKLQIEQSSGESTNPLIYSKTPFLMIDKPVINYSPDAHLQGKPVEKVLALSSFASGKFVKVGDIHFETGNVDIYNDEVNEIVTLLKEGVIM